MSIVYSQEYLQSLLATQQSSVSFLEINDIAMNYNTEYEAFEAVANTVNPYGEAWYYDPVRNAAGDVIGMDYVQVPTGVQNPPAVIDSNVSNPVFTTGGERVRINGSAGGSGSSIFSKGAKVLSTELPTDTLASKVGWGIAAVSLGTKLGKAISRGIYDITGNWAYDPENWDTIVQSDSIDELDKFVFRTLLGLNNNGDITPYMPADALGAMFLTMLQNGSYDPNGYTSDLNTNTFTQPIPSNSSEVMVTTSGWTYDITMPDGVKMALTRYELGTWLGYIIASATPNQTYEERRYQGDVLKNDYVRDIPYSYTYDGKTVYYNRARQWQYNYNDIIITGVTSAGSVYDVEPYAGPVAWTLIYGEHHGVDGIEDDTTGATYIPNPNTITGRDLDTVNQQLRQNYPQLYDGEIYEDVPQPDGTNKRITYVPVPFPNTVTNPQNPTTGSNRQNNPTANPTTTTQDQLDDLIDLITDLVTPNMNPNPNIPDNPDTPPTGSGNTPTVIPPTGNASSLWSVYNPTQAQVDSFGAWLWSSNFVDQLKKLFNDPMQAIIGIHKVFATPTTGETRTIVCGYIDSEVPSKIITSQYTTVDCGTVRLQEYFGNVFDYSPFTEVSLYLPFIGIVRLDVGDVMRASINVKYHVDVITGACLADVIVTRDNAGGVLYQYAGSAIVTYPISSGSYASAIGGILSIAGGIAATVMTGGAAAPAVLGAAAGVTHLHSDVQKSGSFTGAAGAMGGKIPYLIISRPQSGMPSKFEHLQGYPVNYYTKLGSCSGHVRVSDVQVKGMNATDTELNMIRDALLQGVEI